MSFIEKDLELIPASGLSVIKFDDSHTHGLTGYDMKAVDYIIEFPDKYVFLELKDPDDPNARDRDKKRILEDLKDEYLRNNFVKKYRDTFIYRWAQKKTDKPIHYYVMIAAKELNSANYLTRTDKLKKYLPQKYPPVWKRKLTDKCAVLNLKTWNQLFPECKIRRISLISNDR